MKSVIILAILVAAVIADPQNSLFDRLRKQGSFLPNQNQYYRPNPYKVNPTYSGAYDGQYRPDNSGAYNSQDGQYHPDDSGSYRPDSTGGYQHDDNPYAHLNIGYQGYKDNSGNNGGAGGDGSGAGGDGGSGGFGSGDRYTGGSQSTSGGGAGDRNPGGAGDRYPGGAGDRFPGGAGDRFPGGAGDRFPGGASDRFPGSRVPSGSPSGTKNPGGSQVTPSTGSFNKYPGGSQVTAGNKESTFGIVTAIPVPTGLKQGDAAGLYDNRNYGIIRKVEHVEQDGYHYLYETENRIFGEEEGHLEQKGSEKEAMHAKGFFEYTGPDSIVYRVDYTADEDGFHPTAAHLPQAPAIPEAIVRALEYQRAKGLL